MLGVNGESGEEGARADISSGLPWIRPESSEKPFYGRGISVFRDAAEAPVRTNHRVLFGRNPLFPDLLPFCRSLLS